MDTHNLIECPTNIVKVFFPTANIKEQCYLSVAVPELLVFNFLIEKDIAGKTWERKDHALPRTACNPKNFHLFDTVVTNSQHIAAASNLTLDFLSETLE